MTWSINKVILGLSLSLLCWSSITTAGIYKWVDENGQVHFSQTKPKTDTLKPVESLELQGTSKTVARRMGNRMLCGDTDIPISLDDEPIVQLANMRGNVEHYRKNAEAARQSYAEYSRRNFKMKTNRHMSGDVSHVASDYRKKAEELDCAVDWMDKKIAEYEPLRQTFLKDADRVSKEYRQMSDDDAVCGQEPHRGNDRESEQRYQEWANCLTSHRRIDEKNKKLRELKRYESMRDLMED